MLQYYYFETLKTLFGECYIYYFVLTPYNKYLTECYNITFERFLLNIYHFALTPYNKYLTECYNITILNL